MGSYYVFAVFVNLTTYIQNHYFISTNLHSIQPQKFAINLH